MQSLKSIPQMIFSWFLAFTVNNINTWGNESFLLCLLSCKILWLPVILLHHLPEYLLNSVLEETDHPSFVSSATKFSGFQLFSFIASRISSQHPPWIPEIFFLFLSSLAAGNRRPCPGPVLPCNSLHVLADCIPNSGPADWQCNWTPHCCMSIWVVLGLDSISLGVLQCYTHNMYSVYWLCNKNPPQTTMSWLMMLCLFWHPSCLLELI